MKLNLSEDERLILDVAKDFAAKRLSTVSDDVDSQGLWPAATVKEMANLGLFGVIIPEAYGGFFRSFRLYNTVIYEIAKVCASHALTLLSHSFSSHIIASYGTSEQKARWLPKMATGEFLGAVAMTETEAGSDLAAIKTSVTPCEEGVLLTGHKQFITNGSKADVIVVLTSTLSTNPMFNKSLIVVEKPLSGFTTGKSESKLGYRAADTSALFFDNVKLGRHALLGKEGQGMLLIMKSLQCSRLASAALALGIAESAHEEGIRYAKQRKQFGKPISEFQTIQQYLADNETELECARLLLNNAAVMHDQGENTSSYSAMAKYYCSETALRVVSRAMQIHGAYGYMKDFPIERHYRDVRLCTIIEGTSEILRPLISKHVCGTKIVDLK
jgi:alkylation response protein AidB-like acyl-CoA dehydrogenase